jgi:hypothetical protein
MVHIKVAFIAVPVVIGIGVAVTACSSSPGTVKPAVTATQSASAGPSGSPTASASPTASPAGTGSAAAVPQGYTRIGGAAQGISLAAPASWVAINPTTKAIESAASKAGLGGISTATLDQAIASVQKLHGVIVFDVKSAVSSPDHFADNLSAYCGASDVTEVGAAGVPLVKAAASAEFAQVKATHITQRQIEVGGVPGVESSYQLTSSTEGTLDGTQLEVLPAQNKICFVTVTVGKGDSDASVVSTAAATAQFP